MYDVIIIGAGPAGYVAAIRASQLGMKACLIEKDKPGGVCLNVGCIPTKNLIYQAEIFESQKVLVETGIKVDTKGFDFSKVIARSRMAVDRLVKGVEFLINKNKIELIKGTAKIASKNTVTLEDNNKVKGKNILIASGSRPLQIPGFEFDEKQVLSSTGAIFLKKLPKTLIILGAGAIGCEFSYIMNAFGVEVHLVEMEDHILPLEDAEIVSVLSDAFVKKGINISTNTRAVSLKKAAKSVTVTVEEKNGSLRELKAEKALCVFGRKPNTDGVGLENIGIKTEKGCIPVGDYYQTDIKGIYAVGDVIATPQLAHLASKEGEIAVEHIAGLNTKARIHPFEIVSAIYCEPQIAGFGLREEDAKKKGLSFKKAVFPYIGVGKAVALEKPEGLIKVIFDPETHEILGAHIVGREATELIHEILLAKTAELLPADIISMIHAHPTLSEAVLESMLAVEGRAIHY